MLAKVNDGMNDGSDLFLPEIEGFGKESKMSDKRAEILKELEEEAKAWVKEEFARRYSIARETLEKQGKETEEHLKSIGVHDSGKIASQTQMSISYAKSEMYKDVQFEADNWIISELEKRLKEEK